MRPTVCPRAVRLVALVLGGLAPILVSPALALSLYAGAPPTAGGSAVTGPIAVSASLDRNACLGEDVALSASVTDAYGTGIPGAMVTGVVQYGPTAQSFTFPPTADTGIATTQVHTGQPQHGTDVFFSINASAAGYVGETQVSCYAA